MNNATAIGKEILYYIPYQTIGFYDINSPTEGNGGKMVDAALKDFPKDWTPSVIRDWSNGFWDRMAEKHNDFEWMM